jgi:hypothetical protein
MDRKTAFKYKGKEVILDEGNKGSYVAVLENILADPGKPWRAILRITGVYDYPDFSEELELAPPHLKANDRIECPGQRIKVLKHNFIYGYDESVTKALKVKWDKIQELNENTEIMLSTIQQELRRLHAEHLLFEESYVYYELVEKSGSSYIVDKDKGEILALDGCPFEFEVRSGDEWVPALHLDGTLFEIADGQQIRLKYGSLIRLNKSQFDPYKILINELEHPSLIALERGLQQLGIGHEHSVYCHNSLLLQMMDSFTRDTFSGVNFLSYASEKKQFVVQHHYERTYRKNDDDHTYDRFEFTSDSGERILTTYTTQFSGE